MKNETATTETAVRDLLAIEELEPVLAPGIGTSPSIAG
jgi:hypothetical protein